MKLPHLTLSHFLLSGAVISATTSVLVGTSKVAALASLHFTSIASASASLATAFPFTFSLLAGAALGALVYKVSSYFFSSALHPSQEQLSRKEQALYTAILEGLIRPTDCRVIHLPVLNKLLDEKPIYPQQKIHRHQLLLALLDTLQKGFSAPTSSTDSSALLPDELKKAHGLALLSQNFDAWKQTQEALLAIEKALVPGATSTSDRDSLFFVSTTNQKEVPPTAESTNAPLFHHPCQQRLLAYFYDCSVEECKTLLPSSCFG